MPRILLRRGLKKDLVTSVDDKFTEQGELTYCTDTEQMYIDFGDSGNPSVPGRQLLVGPRGSSQNEIINGNFVLRMPGEERPVDENILSLDEAPYKFGGFRIYKGSLGPYVPSDDDCLLTQNTEDEKGGLLIKIKRKAMIAGLHLYIMYEFPEDVLRAHKYYAFTADIFTKNPVRVICNCTLLDGRQQWIENGFKAEDPSKFQYSFRTEFWRWLGENEITAGMRMGVLLRFDDIELDIPPGDPDEYLEYYVCNLQLAHCGPFYYKDPTETVFNEENKWNMVGADTTPYTEAPQWITRFAMDKFFSEHYPAQP